MPAKLSSVDGLFLPALEGIGPSAEAIAAREVSSRHSFTLALAAIQQSKPRDSI
jgi:hypothetical protein